MRTTACAVLLLAAAWGAGCRPASAGEEAAPKSVFAKDNLVAWCVVPFDAARRGPRERAEMLKRLGFSKLAYDWRAEHVPTFEEEVVQLKKHGVQMFAFWGFHPEFVPLVRKHGIAPQFWITAPSPAAPTDEAKVEAAGRQLLPLVKQAGELGCKLGLYNHGGWGGEPANLVAVVKWLRENAHAEHVGIVYNFHHGHGHVRDFAEVLAAMKPHLLCLNLNGMNEDANPKVLSIGAGRHEQAMMETVRQSGYAGPIGILDHRDGVDAEESLRQNLDGLKKVLGRMGDQAALRTY